MGIGIASYVEVTAAGSRTFVGRGMVDVEAVDRAHLWLDRDGVVRIQSTCPDIGQGSHATFAQVAADELGVDLCAVVVEHTDTAKVGRGFGTGMSRAPPPVRRASGERHGRCGRQSSKRREDASRPRSRT